MMSGTPSARAAPTVSVDFYAAEVIASPWEMLREVREAGPIVWNPRGFWMTAQDAICRQVLNTPGSIGQQGTMTAIFGKDAFISIDDRSRHNAIRNVWAPAFRREALAELTSIVTGFVGDMLDSVARNLETARAADITATLCEPLPPTVTSHMLGIPDSMRASILQWTADMANATSSGWPIDYDNDLAWLAGEAAKRQLADYLYQQIEFRRHERGDDLMSQLVHSEVARTMSDEAIMVNVRQMLFAGSETTQKWLGHIVLALSRMPRVREQILRDRNVLPAALEEIMRWETVVHTDPRGVCGKDVSVAGVSLEDGAELILLLGGANRDPARYTDPDVLDIYRPQKAHLGFGFGLHSCLGITLARLEALVATNALLDRFPNYSVIEPVGFNGFNLRGPGTLRLTTG
jgi:cytochrome P450